MSNSTAPSPAAARPRGGTPQPLDYSHPARLQSKPGLYRAAVWCALLPMGFGTAFFLLWLVVGGEVLMLCGLFTLLGGAALFAVGMGCLIAYLWRETRVTVPPRGALARRVALASLLLTANFPLAWGYLGVAFDVMTRCTIVVVNDGARPIDAFVLSGPHFASVPVDLGPIEPGARARHTFRPGMVDGGVTFSMRSGGQTVNGTVTGYAADGTKYTVRAGGGDDGEQGVTVETSSRH